MRYNCLGGRHGNPFHVIGLVNRLLKARDLTASLDLIIMHAADEIKDKSRAPISSGKPTSPMGTIGLGPASRPFSTTSRAAS